MAVIPSTSLFLRFGPFQFLLVAKNDIAAKGASFPGRP